VDGNKVQKSNVTTIVLKDILVTVEFIIVLSVEVEQGLFPDLVTNVQGSVLGGVLGDDMAE